MSATPLVVEPALALLEFDSIAVGIRAGDAMVKRAAVPVLRAGTVQPGKFLVLLGGPVAEVEEARAAGLEAGATSLAGEIFLPAVHPAVVTAIAGGRGRCDREALGVLETRTVAAVIGAADAGVKGAEVELLEIHIADGLGGKGYALFAGAVSDVEAAVELGAASLGSPGELLGRVVIPQIHGEMLEEIHAGPHFRARLR